jgi:hypothetical protein
LPTDDQSARVPGFSMLRCRVFAVNGLGVMPITFQRQIQIVRVERSPVQTGMASSQLDAVKSLSTANCRLQVAVDQFLNSVSAAGRTASAADTLRHPREGIAFNARCLLARRWLEQL